LFLANFGFLPRNRLAGMNVPPRGTSVFAQLSGFCYEPPDSDELPLSGPMLFWVRIVVFCAEVIVTSEKLVV